MLAVVSAVNSGLEHIPALATILEFLTFSSTKDYVYEVTMFFYLLKFLPYNTKNDLPVTAGKLVGSACTSLFRAFGSAGLIVPIMLGKGDALKDLDFFLGLWAAAQVYQNLMLRATIRPNIAQAVNGTAGLLGNLTQAIYEVSVCVAAYTAAKSNFSGSLGTPVIFGFLSLYSARLIEKGIAGAFDSAFANEYLLGVFGTVFYKIVTDYDLIPAATCHCLLVMLRFYGNTYDFGSQLNSIWSKVTKIRIPAGYSASPKRSPMRSGSRGKSPMRKSK